MQLDYGNAWLRDVVMLVLKLTLLTALVIVVLFGGYFYIRACRTFADRFARESGFNELLLVVLGILYTPWIVAYVLRLIRRPKG